MFKSLLSFVIIFIAASTISVGAFAQNIKSYSWSYTKMDSTWHPKSLNETGVIINKYRGGVEALMKPIGVAERELKSYFPESPLSNLTADVLYKYGQQYLDNNGYKRDVDFAITNFGGIRTEMGKGDITPFGIFSIYPFENKVVILSLKGEVVLEMLENLVEKRYVQVFSGVEIEIDGKEIKKFLIGGKKVKKNKLYNVVTIDFMYNGGDGVSELKEAVDVINTEAVIRDVVTDYIKAETAAGRKINGYKDGRVVVKNRE